MEWVLLIFMFLVVGLLASINHHVSYESRQRLAEYARADKEMARKERQRGS